MNDRLLNAMGMLITREIKRRIRSNQVTPPSKSRGTTLVKSGALINSIRHIIAGDKVTVGSNLVYARIHHEGGVIRPKRAKALAIPLTSEAAKRNPRHFSDTFIRKGVILQKQEDGSLVALYALKPSVTIPARPYMNIDPNTRASLKQMIVDYARKNLTDKE